MTTRLDFCSKKTFRGGFSPLSGPENRRLGHITPNRTGCQGSKRIDFFRIGVYNFFNYHIFDEKEGGEVEMKKTVSAILSLLMISVFVFALVGCGADIKAENEKLKAENATLKADSDKLKLDVQKLKEEVQKAAEKDATITSLTADNEALKKQIEEMKAQTTKKKK